MIDVIWLSAAAYTTGKDSRKELKQRERDG